jgi:hypothetical protein
MAKPQKPQPQPDDVAALGAAMVENLKAYHADPEAAEAAREARDAAVTPSQYVTMGQPTAKQAAAHAENVEDARQAGQKIIPPGGQ